MDLAYVHRCDVGKRYGRDKYPVQLWEWPHSMFHNYVKQGVYNENWSGNNTSSTGYESSELDGFTVHS